jgi:hypothetical protein
MKYVRLREAHMSVSRGNMPWSCKFECKIIKFNRKKASVLRISELMVHYICINVVAILVYDTLVE